MKTEGLLAANRGLKTQKCKKRCRKSCRANLETHSRNRLVAVIVFARSGRETIHLLTVLSRSHTAHALEQGVEMSIFMVPNHMGNLQHRFIGAAQQFFGAVDPLFCNNIGIGFSRLLSVCSKHLHAPYSIWDIFSHRSHNGVGCRRAADHRRRSAISAA